MAQDSTTNSSPIAQSTPGLAWFMRRAAIGVTLLFVFVVSIAWLTHTSLQADTEATAAISDDVPEAPPANAAVIRPVPVATERHQVKTE